MSFEISKMYTILIVYCDRMSNTLLYYTIIPVSYNCDVIEIRCVLPAQLRRKPVSVLAVHFDMIYVCCIRTYFQLNSRAGSSVLLIASDPQQIKYIAIAKLSLRKGVSCAKTGYFALNRDWNVNNIWSIFHIRLINSVSIILTVPNYYLTVHNYCMG